jgi:hypothetical protein
MSPFFPPGEVVIEKTKRRSMNELINAMEYQEQLLLTLDDGSRDFWSYL